MDQRRIDGIMRLEGPRRYDHFVKRVVDQERAFGLHGDGWALSQDDDGRELFPLWPDAELAAPSAVGEWEGLEAKEIPLTELIETLLPMLVTRGLAVAVFPVPSGAGVVREPTDLAADLRAEEAWYG